MTVNNVIGNNIGMKKAYAGFTLIELLVTIAVAAIVITVALPSFGDFIRNNRLVTQANTLITSLNIARSEAIKRGMTVNVCSSNNQISCTSTNWKDGWIVVTTDATPEVLRVYESLSGQSSLTNATTTIGYKGSGFLNGAASTFQLCDERTAETGRQISVSLTGHPSVQDLNCT
ncbi:MAG: GspH/FimT family pseudopilin [Gammaproteobacteria bacterium]